MPPFSDRFEPETDDMGHEMTPQGVFFLLNFLLLFFRDYFVNGSIVFQVMGEQAARRLQKDHSMTKETRPGMGAFFLHTAVEKRRK